MPIVHLLIIYLIQLIFLLFPYQGYAILFRKAGLEKKNAHLPFINSWYMLQLLEKKSWNFYLHFFGQFVPIIGWFVSINLIIDFLKRMNIFGFIDYLKFLFLGFLFSKSIAEKKNVAYITYEELKNHKKTLAREWLDAIIYAVIVAYLLRTFFFEAFAIPTSSMESTMLINDYLFVNKFKYGFRVPTTPIAVPFVHHTIPGTHMQAYSKLIQLPYIRWFAKSVERNDIVVFNFPVGDTVINRDEFQSAITYYQVLREIGRKNVLDDKQRFPLTVRPLDKRENFVKRCVAIAGDTLQLINGVLYINGNLADTHPHQKYKYVIKTESSISTDYLINELNINLERESGDFYYNPQQNMYIISLTQDQVKYLQKQPTIKGIERYINVDSSIQILPYDKSFHWNSENIGPLWVPKKGESIELNHRNYILYQRVINVYEKQHLIKRGGAFFLNGKEVNNYTFQQNYYWMMGDNRDNSLDSRYWGFVPEDHIIGSPSFIWYSKNQEGIRWKRIFKPVY